MRIISHMPLDCNTELIEKTLLKTRALKKFPTCNKSLPNTQK